MRAKTFSLRDPLEENLLLAAVEQAQHSLFVAEALAAGLTMTEIADGYKVGVAAEGTTERLVEFFRRLADLHQYGFYAVQMGEDALSEEPNADNWAGWWDDRVDDPLMKFTVALPNGSQD